MRTTLDIADDVLLAAKALADRENKSVGLVISDLARQGFHARQQSDVHQAEFLGFRPLPARDIIISPELIERLRAQEAV